MQSATVFRTGWDKQLYTREGRSCNVVLIFLSFCWHAIGYRGKRVKQRRKKKRTARKRGMVFPGYCSVVRFLKMNVVRTFLSPLASLKFSGLFIKADTRLAMYQKKSCLSPGIFQNQMMLLLTYSDHLQSLCTWFYGACTEPLMRAKGHILFLFTAQALRVSCTERPQNMAKWFWLMRFLLLNLFSWPKKKST